MANSKTEIVDSLATQRALTLGKRLGHHEAFNAIANRCSAADAETLREIRESGLYKHTNLTWDQFCRQHVGVSRSYADRLIRHLEEFGANYFRLSELVEVSAATYRLLAPAVSDAGLSFEGQVIPIKPENRGQIQAAVDSMRAAPSDKPSDKPAGPLTFQDALQRLLASVKVAERSFGRPGDRILLVGALSEESRRIEKFK
jgi:hypothetical protein